MRNMEWRDSLCHRSELSEKQLNWWAADFKPEELCVSCVNLQVSLFLSVSQEHDVETPYGMLHVVIRGAPKGNKPAILTYHDVGLNREYLKKKTQWKRDKKVCVWTDVIVSPLSRGDNWLHSWYFCFNKQKESWYHFTNKAPLIDDL